MTSQNRSWARSATLALAAASVTAALTLSLPAFADEAATQASTRAATQPATQPATKPVEANDEAETGEAGFELEDVFLKRGSLFGPSAGSMAFSHDGKFAAFLYRPHDERRHGSDLYVHNVETGESRRITSAARLAKYSADAREVVEDREKKLKRAKDARLADYTDDAKSGDDGNEEQAEAAADVRGTFAGTANSDNDMLAEDTSCTISITGEQEASFTAGLIAVNLRDIERDGDTINSR
ncbi:MAG: hypothetical protein AAGK78_04160, partial [Planctomycetota bacterium]